MPPKRAADPGDLFTVKQIAVRSGLSEKTIRRAMKGGPRGLAYVKIGEGPRADVRISDAQYADWVRRNSMEPQL